MSREIDIRSIRSRPRFKIRTHLSKQEFTDRLRKQFLLQKHVLGGYVGDQVSEIHLHKDQNNYWAPILQIRIEQNEENPNISIIKGTVGLRSAVWILFIFLYTLGATFLIFFGLIWLVQMRLDIESSLIVWAWIGILILVGTFIAAFIGRRIAKGHIAVLRDFMEKVVHDELEDTLV